ncbi:FabD/lysophospholipase-like protein [Lophium mytilinum]|uniref:FabD/lysophospholipase-like protein n=1 Tax=Lophium mytilinum TaxID=390894 RepID=A0A6A6RAV3_9PEZI|nr:FabD/lysophospholipase-like protein [Lophium mytilinum]
MAAAHGVDAQSPAPSTLSQSQMGDGHTLDNTGYCILSLDGGGVRGLATLCMLQSIMNRLNYEREEAGLRPRKPCEIFDLIGGTSTGGLIAIMLGRLEMSVEECIVAYKKMMKQVFEKKANRSFIGILGGVQPRFSSKALENAISQVIKGCGLSVDERLENGTRPRCKVFVCTKFQKTNAITRLRSYRLPAGSDFHPTILEAALATSAAPTYFSDTAIAGSKFVDGALGANNPVVEVEEEAADLWCEETGHLQPLVKCFISIGTGHPGTRSVSDKGLKNLVQTLQKEATETENTNQQFLGRWRDYVEKDRCFRFNVEHGLENVELAEFQQQDLIQAATSTYLRERGTKGKVRMCVENLRTKEYHPTAEFIRELKQKTLVGESQRPSQALSRATTSEIAELINLGNSNLKVSPDRITIDHLKQARHYFSKALHYLENNPASSPKQVSRVCQRLMETSIGLSMKVRDAAERKRHANQAHEYGKAALDNVLRCQDICMIAQVQFLLACVSVWKVYLEARTSGVEPKSHPERDNVEVLVVERLEELRRFQNLDMEAYEAQARKYLSYLMKPSRNQAWE